MEGLSKCVWPGRANIVKLPGNERVTLYIDGAHTVESVMACKSWFMDQVSKQSSPFLVLLFSCKQTKEPRMLLAQAHSVPFSQVFITTLSVEQETKPENVSWTQGLASIWEEMGNNSIKPVVLNSVKEAVAQLQQLNCDANVLVTGSLYLVGALLTVLPGIIKLC